MSELTKIQAELKAFACERDWNKFHTPENLAKAINIEAAELLEDFLWTDPSSPITGIGVTRYQDRASEEIADILIYALMFCEKMGIDPIRAIQEKIAINAEKYPVEKCKGRATKYDKL